MTTNSSAIQETALRKLLRSLCGGAAGTIADWFDRRRQWQYRSSLSGILILTGLRARLRSENLFDSGRGSQDRPATPLPDAPVRFARTLDGTDNFDLDAEPGRLMGSVGGRFGRNIDPRILHSLARRNALLEPDPVNVADELMTRTRFRAAEHLNLLAAGWIQLQVHDWFDHGPGNPNRTIVLRWSKASTRTGPMRVRQTEADPSPPESPGTARTFVSKDTHWWDASSIYGVAPESAAPLGPGGVTFDCDPVTGLLPLTPPGDDGPDVNRNSWLGLELIRALFMMEHDSVVTALRKNEVHLTEQQCADTARLVVAALMAKIHTLEWTAAMLDHPTTRRGVRQLWWGIFGPAGQRLLRGLGIRNAILTGIPGSRRRLHGVDYSITEEFVSVYRMHSLLPDSIAIKHPFPAGAGEPGELDLAEVVKPHTADLMRKHHLANLLYSLGRARCGRITLNNYPTFLRTFPARDGSGYVLDLAAVDILRDREREVPRYNDFRERLRMPRITRFDELGCCECVTQRIEQVYRHVDDIDLQVGLLAEEPPKGFAFSETAFRIFLLMAERRLEADRFYTDDFTVDTYTRTGLDWVQGNTMSSVLIRHFPDLKPALAGVPNPFRPWNQVGTQGRAPVTPGGPGSSTPHSW